MTTRISGASAMNVTVTGRLNSSDIASAFALGSTDGRSNDGGGMQKVFRNLRGKPPGSSIFTLAAPVQKLTFKTERIPDGKSAQTTPSSHQLH